MEGPRLCLPCQPRVGRGVGGGGGIFMPPRWSSSPASRNPAAGAAHRTSGSLPPIDTDHYEAGLSRQLSKTSMIHI